MDMKAQGNKVDIDAKALEKSLAAYVSKLPRGKTGEKVYDCPWGTVSFIVDRYQDGKVGIQTSYAVDFEKESQISEKVVGAVTNVVREFSRQSQSLIANVSMFRSKPQILEPILNEQGMEKLPLVRVSPAPLPVRKNNP